MQDLENICLVKEFVLSSTEWVTIKINILCSTECPTKFYLVQNARYQQTISKLRWKRRWKQSNFLGIKAIFSGHQPLKRAIAPGLNNHSKRKSRSVYEAVQTIRAIHDISGTTSLLTWWRNSSTYFFRYGATTQSNQKGLITSIDGDGRTMECQCKVGIQHNSMGE